MHYSLTTAREWLRARTCTRAYTRARMSVITLSLSVLLSPLSRVTKGK
jgi:hypothetical protein